MNQIILVVAIIGIALLSYGQVVNGQLDPNNYLNTRDENQHNDNNGIGELLKHKGDLYCYDSNTTTTKEVKQGIKYTHQSPSPAGEMNDFLTDTLKNNGNMSLVQEMCDNMVDLYIITKEDYHKFKSMIPDNDIEIEGTLELEIK
jgi:5-bromo-4-chloroindolyl phosphate hydrolysis protein